MEHMEGLNMQTLDQVEAARLAHMNGATLRKAVRKRDVLPVVRGRKGRGYATRYRYGTVLGLIMVQALRECLGGCGREVLRAFAAETDETFLDLYESWVRQHKRKGGNPDPWADEADASDLQRLPYIAEMYHEAALLIGKRHNDLFAYYHARHGGTASANPRISRRATKAAKK
jgi:hypothetical protein